MGALLVVLGLLRRAGERDSPQCDIALALVWCCAIGGFANAPGYGSALGLLFVAGFCELALYTMTQTLVQLNAPPEIRGRVIGLFAMSALGLRTFSGFTVGMLGGVIGIHWSLALSALTLLLLVTALWVFLCRRAPSG